MRPLSAAPRPQLNKTLQTVACNAFLELQKAAAAENVTVWMQSGYRSVSYQTNLYEKKTNYYKQQAMTMQRRRKWTAAIVNRRAYSEHNCGLAADLNSPEHTGLDEGFENTAAFRWLCQHAGEYGFILRYPKGAEEKTEITYEPWHWRYVAWKMPQRSTPAACALRTISPPCSRSRAERQSTGEETVKSSACRLQFGL